MMWAELEGSGREWVWPSKWNQDGFALKARENCWGGLNQVGLVQAGLLVSMWGCHLCRTFIQRVLFFLPLRLLQADQGVAMCGVSTASPRSRTAPQRSHPFAALPQTGLAFEGSSVRMEKATEYWNGSKLKHFLHFQRKLSLDLEMRNLTGSCCCT